jgi:LacI family transcriptional regulator
VHGPLSIRQIADRRRGMLKAIRTAGLDPDRALLDLSTPAQTIREGEQSVEKLLGATLKPTAVFCANDLLALGVMRALIKRGISIPRDMALVGYDDVEFASVLATPLTSIRQPKYELGRAAAELLLDEANNPATHQHQHIMYQPELIVRESSRSQERIVP